MQNCKFLQIKDMILYYANIHFAVAHFDFDFDFLTISHVPLNEHMSS